MECSKSGELLSDYLDGILDLKSATELEVHLSGCERCRQEFDHLKALVTELNRMESIRAPDDFLNQIHKRLQPRFSFDNVVKKLFFPLRIKIPLEFAAAAIVAVIIFSVLAIRQPERQLVRATGRSISSSAVEKELDGYRVSPELIKSKAKPDLRHTTPRKLAEENQPIVLAMVIKIGESGPVTQSMGIQDAATEPLPGKVAGVMETESRPSIHFSEQKSMPQPPVAESAEKIVPARSPRQAASPRKDEQEVKEKALLNLSETIQRLIKIVQSLEGSVLSESDTEPFQSPRMVTVSLPARRYDEFVAELERMAPFRMPPPSYPVSDQDSIHMQISFILSD
ncbi:MAG: zf-HC2 domain-containing protein [Deltaproteobacteria bacterium]|nr:MAG: zf-HC2 domain-containing protein [Deltaproteobacteria bacterium]